MSADWVAASVRARSMAQNRIGEDLCRVIATQASLEAGLGLLTQSVYSIRLASMPETPTLAHVEHALRASTLWQLRVLSGWMPVGGHGLARALAAEYEMENILSVAAQLGSGTPPDPTVEPAFLDLGALATAWRRARTAQTPEELAQILRTSRWGEVGSGASSLRDILTLSRLGRLADASHTARPWARSAAGLLVARVVLVDQAQPSHRLQQLARPLVGARWLQATDVHEMRDALPYSARITLDGIDTPQDLWRAEARHRGTMESDALRLLRSALPGPDVVLAGVVVQAVDAWRLWVALSAAAAGRGASEVIDAVA